MATTRIKDLSKTATTVNSDANLVLDGNTGGTQKISRDNFRQDTADAFVAAPGTYNLAPLNSGTGKIDAVYLSSSSDTPKGAWDASTNTPTLADGSGTAGDYYDVTVAGSSDLGSGSIAFTVGDVVKYNGTVWFKIDSVANILDGVSTIDGAKTAIEIPDVGTGPSQVPLNQHLGTMAYQSSDGVSVGTVSADEIGVGTSDPNYEIEVQASNARIAATSDGGVVNHLQSNSTTGFVGTHTNHPLALKTNGTTRATVTAAGLVGIGTTSPDAQTEISKSTAGDILKISGGSETRGLIFTSSTSAAGSVGAKHTLNAQSTNGEIAFAVSGAEKWKVDSSGNLVANGTAIDFGSVSTSAGDGTGTTGTPASSVLSDYEFGSWVPRFEMTGSNFAALTMDVIAAHYCKVGRHVFCQANIMTDNVDTTGATGTVAVQGLPFVSETTTYSGNLSVGYSSLWVNAPTAGYVHPNASYASLTRIGTTGITAISASDVTNGASSNVNQLIFTVSYIAST